MRRDRAEVRAAAKREGGGGDLRRLLGRPHTERRSRLARDECERNEAGDGAQHSIGMMIGESGRRCADGAMRADPRGVARRQAETTTENSRQPSDFPMAIDDGFPDDAELAAADGWGDEFDEADLAMEDELLAESMDEEEIQPRGPPQPVPGPAPGVGVRVVEEEAAPVVDEEMRDGAAADAAVNTATDEATLEPAVEPVAVRASYRIQREDGSHGTLQLLAAQRSMAGARGAGAAGIGARDRRAAGTLLSESI